MKFIEAIIALCCCLIVDASFLSPEVKTAPVGSPRKVWALLVAGSAGFDNYRHQADVCHAYQLLRRNGIPKENIITMMVDDVAYSSRNPTPGVIINMPNGTDVYSGIEIDYKGQTVDPTNFLNILTGNATAMEGIGTGRVIESGPDDYVFVNFVDHGGAGVLCFPNEVLLADDLIKVLNGMAADSKFYKLIMYIEACHAGSMFDDLLDDDKNILVLTASDPHESSYACYFDEQRETYLGDVFSVMWLNDSEHEYLTLESIHHQFERVRTLTNTSHVEEYGDLDIGNTKLSEIIGFRMGLRGSNTWGSGAWRFNPSKIPPITDAVSNIDVPISLIDKMSAHTKDSEKQRDLKIQKHHLLKKRAAVDHMMDQIINLVAGENSHHKGELKYAKYTLGKKNFPCYRQLLTHFSQYCYNVAKHPYVRKQLPVLVNMCASPWVDIAKAKQAMSISCGELINPSMAIH